MISTPSGLKQAHLAERFGRHALLGDVAWSTANHKIPELASRKDWRALSELHRAMARHLYDAGRDHFQQAQQAVRYELLTFQRTASTVVLRSGSLDNCCANECGHCSSRAKRMPVRRARTYPYRRDCGYP
jgi:hypothetical protein